jgi:hypothetical protein
VATSVAAFSLLVTGFFAGWHWHKWRYAENDLQGARNRLANAAKAAWHARGWVAAVVIIGWGLWDFWASGGGH